MDKIKELPSQIELYDAAEVLGVHPSSVAAILKEHGYRHRGHYDANGFEIYEKGIRPEHLYLLQTGELPKGFKGRSAGRENVNWGAVLNGAAERAANEGLEEYLYPAGSAGQVGPAGLTQNSPDPLKEEEE